MHVRMSKSGIRIRGNLDPYLSHYLYEVFDRYIWQHLILKCGHYTQYYLHDLMFYFFSVFSTQVPFIFKHLILTLMLLCTNSLYFQFLLHILFRTCNRYKATECLPHNQIAWTILCLIDLSPLTETKSVFL